MAPKFTFQELSDTYDRAYSTGAETMLIRCAANLLSMAQEYRNRGDYVGARAMVDAWQSTRLLTESTTDG